MKLLSFLNFFASGVYVGFANHFNIGAFMEKCLTMRGGQTPCQKYWRQLLDMVDAGKLDPTIVITHRLPLTEAAQAYHIFNDKLDDCIKVRTRHMYSGTPVQ